MNQCPFCKAEIFASDIDRCPNCGRMISDSDDVEKSPNETAETFVSDEFMTEDHTHADNIETIDDPSTAMDSSENQAHANLDDSVSEDETFVADELAARIQPPVEKTVAFEREDVSEANKESDSSADSNEGETYQTVEADPESTLAEIDEEIEGTVLLDENGEGLSIQAATEATVEIPQGSSDQTIRLDELDEDPSNTETFVTADSQDLQPNESSDDDSYSQTLASDDLNANESELKTLQSNWDDRPGDKPEMTIKSRQDAPSDEELSPTDTITSVPLRSLQTINEKSTDRLKTPEYELLSILGEGGMGIVWSAKQTSVDRKVAVKMIKGNFSKKKGQRNKFLAEAIVTGDLDHPNIVPIYDVGSDKAGSLFYAMKQVQGTPWLKVIKEKSLQDNLEILLRVADAVAFAHARGIVHRDLKPENVMLGEFGEVLVMDWGLALPLKNFHNAERIRSISSMGGTPAYMSPEMATGPIDRITPQSDVYLLGAMLWEVVTGRPPHPGKKVQQCLLAAMRNTIRETEKSGELIDIARKAMATAIKDRHATVREFQEEVRDYLDHSESLALASKAKADLKQAENSSDYNEFSKAVFGFEQARDLWTGNKAAVDGVSDAKFAYANNAYEKADYDLALSLLSPEREDHSELRSKIQDAQHERDARQSRLKLAKRAMMAMAACFLIVVSIGFLVISHEKAIAEQNAIIAKKNEKIAKDNERIATNQTKIAKQKTAEVEQKSLELANALTRVSEEKVKAENAREAAVAAQKKTDAANKDLQVAILKAEMAREAEVEARKETDTANKELQIALKDARQQKDKAELAQKKAVAEEQKAVKANDELQVALVNLQKQKNIADAKSVEALAAKDEAEEARKAEEYEAYIARIGLAAAKIKENSFDVADHLLEQCPEPHRNWEWGRLKHLCSFAKNSISVKKPVDAVSISPDGQFLLSGSWDNKARIWNLKSRKLIHELPHNGLYIHAVAWSSDQSVIATAGSDSSGRIRLWKSDGGELLSKFNGHTEPVVSVKFSPQGNWLLTCSYDETARLWNIKDPRNPIEVQVLKNHSWWVWDGAFSPDFDPSNPLNDNRIVTVGQDGKAIVWKLKSSEQESSITTVSLVQSTNISGEAKSIEMVQESIFTGHDKPIYSVAYSPDGTEVATASYDKRILIWNPTDVPAFDLDNLLLKKNIEMRQRVLSGHSAPVQSLSYSKDGKLLISGGRDNAVKVWDTTTGTSIKTFRGHHSAVRSVDISPDGRQVVSGAKDSSIIFWNINEYEELRVLNGQELVGHQDAVLGAKFSTDGDRILTAGRDRTARLWDTKTGKPIRVFEEGHDFLTSKGVFLHNERVLATSAADNSVRLWNVETGTQLLRIPDTGRVAIMAASPDGEWLVTGYDPKQVESDNTRSDKTPKQWSVLVWNVERLIAASAKDILSKDLKTHVQPIELVEHYNRISAVAFASRNNLLITCDYKGRAILWDMDQRKSLWSHRYHQSRITDCSFSADEARIYLASTDRTISSIDTKSGDEYREEILKHPSGVSDLKVSPNGSKLASICQLETDFVNPGSIIKIWNLETLKEEETLEFENFAVNELHYSPSGDSALIVCNDNKVRIVDFTSESNISKSIHPVLDFEKLGGLVWAASFTSDGHSILTVGGSEARIWDATNYQEVMSFSPHGAVAAADFSGDGKYIVTGSWDNSAKIWDLNTGHAVKKLIGGHAGYINSAVFSPNSQYVLTGSDDRTAKLWNLTSGQVVQTYEGHEGPVNKAIFSPDGKSVLTVSNDKTARLWDTESGQQIGEPFRQHDWAILCGAFSPDGKKIITGGEDNFAFLWDLQKRTPPVKFEGHTAAITDVCFAEDGSRIFTASQDNSAKIWDATPEREGAEILTLTEQDQELTSIAVSPDGTQIVTGSRDGSAVVWLTTNWEKPSEKSDEIQHVIQ